MTNKFVITSDAHLSSTYSLSTSPHPFKDRIFLAAYTGAKQPIDYAIKNNIPIINGGDWFDKEKIESPEYAITKSLLDSIEKKGIKAYINLGNHEIDYIEGIPSIMRSISSGYRRVYTPVTKKRYTIYRHDDLKICMIPYYPESIFNEVLDELSKEISGNAILVIHQNIKGIRLGKTSLKEGIDKDEFFYKIKDKFKAIINGHLHFRSIINGDVPIIIPGSTCSMDFRDQFSVKSFYVVEFDKDYNVIKVDTIPIKNQIVFEEIDVLKVDKKYDAKNKYIRLLVRIDDKYKKTETKLLKDGAIRVQIEEIPESKTIDLTGYARPLEMTTEDWLNQWLNDKEDDDGLIPYIIKKNKEIFGND